MNPSAESFRSLPPSFRIASAVQEIWHSPDSWIHEWLLDNQTRMNQHSSSTHSIRMFTFFLVKLKTPIRIIKAPTLAVIHLNQEGTNRSKNDMGWRTTSLHKKWPLAPETQDWPWIASANPSAHLPRNIRQILEAYTVYVFDTYLIHWTYIEHT